MTRTIREPWHKKPVTEVFSNIRAPFARAPWPMPDTDRKDWPGRRRGKTPLRWCRRCWAVVTAI